MNSLELILRKIDDDGNAAARDIIEKANEKAEEIRKDKMASAEKEAAEKTELAKKHSQQLIENAKGSCEALIRKEELRTKSEIIDEWIKKAVSSAKNADRQEYFKLIEKLAVKYSQSGRGILHMSKRDIDDMPSDFMTQLNESLASKGASLELCGDPAKTDGGFIISYGMIEENCCFDALLEDKLDEIKDSLFSVLNR